MNQGRTWVVGALIGLAICAALLWMDREERTGPDPVDNADTLRPDPDLLAARTKDAPHLEGRAAEAPASVDAETRWVRLEAASGNGTFVVRGIVMRGFTAPAPGTRVIGSAFAGYEKKGKALVRVALRADAEGWFAWPMSPPTRVTYLHFELVEASTFFRGSTGALIAPGQPPPPHVTLYMLPPDARIVGRVMDRNGKPLPDAVILTSSQSKPTPCDAEGRYEIAATSVTDDSRLTARAPGFAIQRATVAVPKTGAIVTHDFKLEPEYRVYGRVTDPDGNPLQGAVVKSFGTAFWNDALTDENGLYELGHLDALQRSLGVYARHPKYTEVQLFIKPSGKKQEVNFQLGRGSRVMGHVVDSTGRGLPGAQLYLGFSQSAYNRLDARAKEEGRFEFPVVPPGTHTLAVEHHGLAPHKETVSVPKDGGVAGLVVTLRKGRRASGRVVDESGAPVGGMRMSLRHQKHYVGSSHRTDADGRFEIHGVPNDSVELWVFRVGYERLKVPLDGDIEDLRLVVQRAGRLAGCVLDDETDKPVPSFVIRFVEPELAEGEKRGWDYAATWQSVGRRFENTKGIWDTGGENLPRGTVFGIEVTADGYAPAFNRHVVATPDPDPTSTTIRLNRGTAVTGVARDAKTGAPVSDAVVKIRISDSAFRESAYEDWDARNPLRTKTDAKGLFRIEAVLSGWIRISIEHDDYAPTVHGPVRVRSAAFDAGTIKIGKGSTIRGRAADVTGKPIAGAVVILMEWIERRPPQPPRRGRTRRTNTDQSGAYAFTKVPAGTYRVERLLTLPGGNATGAYVVQVEVRDGEQEVPLAPTGSATVKGTVALLESAPRGLVVRLTPAGGRQSGLPQRATALVDGTFAFARVEAGSYSVTCGYTQMAGNRHVYRSGTARVEVTGGATAEVALEVD